MQIAVLKIYKGSLITATPSARGFWRASVVGQRATFFDRHPALVAQKAANWINSQKAVSA